VLAHVVEYGAVHRHALMDVLRELGAEPGACDDPLDREARRSSPVPSERA
jgi:uncharacterized damage-inducible protein DinB